MMKKKEKFQHPSRHNDSRFKKKNKEENNEIICFECKKTGYLKKKRYFEDKKKNSMMVTWDDLDSDKSNSSDDEQANICLLANTSDKVKVKTYFESDTSFVLHQMMKKICPMMFFFKICKKFKEKFKVSSSKNIELRKSKEFLEKENKKKTLEETLKESLSLASKTNETSIVEKLREEVAYLTNDFGKEQLLTSHYLLQTNVTSMVNLDTQSLDASMISAMHTLFVY
ncbi:hypothetical protein HKD37_20G055682 [Glycine soja]